MLIFYFLFDIIPLFSWWKKRSKAASNLLVSIYDIELIFLWLLKMYLSVLNLVWGLLLLAELALEKAVCFMYCYGLTKSVQFLISSVQSSNLWKLAVINHMNIRLLTEARIAVACFWTPWLISDWLWTLLQYYFDICRVWEDLPWRCWRLRRWTPLFAFYFWHCYAVPFRVCWHTFRKPYLRRPFLWVTIG